MTKTIKKFYSYFWRYKWYFIVSLTCALSASVFNAFLPFFYRYLVNHLSGLSIHTLVVILGLCFLSRIGFVVSDNLAAYFGDQAAIPASRDARLDAFSHLQWLDFAFHVNKKSGEFISKIKRGDNAFWDMYFAVNNQLLGDAFDFILVGVSLSLLRFDLVVILLVSFILNIIISLLFLKKNMVVREGFHKEEDNVSHLIVDNLINYETVKYFAKEKREIRNLKTAFLPWESTLWNYGITFRHMGVIMGLVSTATLMAMLAITGREVAAGTLSVGDFVFTMTLMLQFFPKFERVIARMRQIAKSYADLVSYFSILENPLVMPDAVQPEMIAHPRGEVEFNDVSFVYPSGQDALHNIDFKIKMGETVALVGRSGAGKTTITKLVMRMYDPDSGTVRLDGHDIRMIAKENLRTMIGLVPQEPILFNNTIGYNIGYPLDNIGQEEIIAAAKLANLHDFISSLEKGYETMVGERGVKLSGGQKQRLAIARVFLLNPTVIIFDEATSHLDSESEMLIQDSIEHLRKNKTMIMIAHRLSTVMKADRIFVLDGGRIAEVGTHGELVRKSSGIYRRLWELQTENEIT